MVSSLVVTDALKLAELLGISENDPFDFLWEACTFGQDRSDTTLAYFCANYLPKLVQSLEDPQVPTVDFSFVAIRVLFYVLDQPLLKYHFLRTSDSANLLLSRVVIIFTSRSVNRSLFANTSQDAENYISGLGTLLHVISILISHALILGSASKLNLIIPPSLGAEFLAKCQIYLSTPFIVAQKYNQSATNDVTQFRAYIERLPAALGVEGAGKVAMTGSVLSNSTSDGTLACELSKFSRDSDGLGFVAVGCSAGLGQMGKLKLCSICRSVCYCSSEHQKADWKKHKKVCFAPSW